jgi:anthranilate phosphoribosyltransferase
MKKILEKLYQNQILTQNEAHSILIEIGSGKFSEVELASFLTVFNMRSLTLGELKGFRKAMLEMSLKIELSDYEAIDIVGTGGDGKDTFNISTLSCFVVAGCGQKVIKHGSYSASSVSGSSNMIEYFGHTFSNNQDELQKSLDQTGICFLHAPLFHPAMKNIAPVRKSLRVKTFFNILGPLINPAQPNYQLFGTYNAQVARLYNYLLEETDKNYAVIYSLDGYDEVSLTSPVKIFTPKGEMQLNFQDFGLQKPLLQSEIMGDKTIEGNAKIFLSVLEGNGTFAQNQVVIANAALALHCCNPTESLLSCVEQARESLKKGRALSVFKKIMQL